MYKQSLLLLAIIISGCQAMNPEIKDHTLAGNPKIPEENIKLFYQGNNWDELKNRPYDAFVILRGTVRKDKSVDIRKVLESYPGDSWVKKALKMAKHVKLSPTTIGSRVPPGAEVYVVFYETDTEPRIALIFAKQTGAAVGSSALGQYIYLTFYVY